MSSDSIIRSIVSLQDRMTSINCQLMSRGCCAIVSDLVNTLQGNVSCYCRAQESAELGSPFRYVCRILTIR